MRDLALLLALLLLMLVLLYGGLNLVERSMAEMMMGECRHEAFSIRGGADGGLTIIFAGKDARFHAGELFDAIKLWWDKLRDYSAAFLRG